MVNGKAYTLRLLTMLTIHSMFSERAQTNESASGVNYTRGAKFAWVVFAH